MGAIQEFMMTFSGSQSGSIYPPDSSASPLCRAFITETLIPPKDDEDTEESNDKSDFRDFISNWLDKFRGNKTEMDKVELPGTDTGPQISNVSAESDECASWVIPAELRVAAEHGGVPCYFTCLPKSLHKEECCVDTTEMQ